MAPSSKPITEITKTTIRQIAAEAEVALTEVAERLGLKLDSGGGKYDPGTGTFTPKFTFSLPDSGAREWARYASLIGLTDEDYGATIRSNGKTFTLSGINLRAPKFPVNAKCVEDGRSYKFPERTVQALLAAERANGARS